MSLEKGNKEKLLENAKNTIKELQDKIKEIKEDVLSTETREEKLEAIKERAKKEKERIEETLQNMGEKIQGEFSTTLDSFKEIINTRLSITNSPSDNSGNENPGESTHEQGILSKTQNWVGDQRDAIRDRQKWGEEGGKNTLRTAGFLVSGAGAIAITYKGIKELWKRAFNDKDEEDDGEDEEKETKSKKKEKKSFWNTWYGEAIKWTGIGTGAYYVAHGLATGDRNPLNMFKWGEKIPTATSKPEDQVTGAENLKEEEPEEFEKYKEIGNNIDNQYKKIWEKEINAGWEGMDIDKGYETYIDKSKLTKEEFKAIVPMCVDNQFSSVGDMLSEGGYYKYTFDKDFTDFKDAFLRMLNNFKDNTLKSILPFLNSIKSFQGHEGTLDSIKDWLNNGDQSERRKELDLFFRQYTKVLTYMNDKRTELKEIIAKKKYEEQTDAGEDMTKYATREDALKDGEWVEKYVENDSEYMNFMSGNMTNAINIMKQENIFNDKLSSTVEGIKNSIDSFRAETLNEDKNGKDALSRLKEKKDNLNDAEYNEGLETANNINEDIEENFDKERSYMYFSATHKLINTEDENIQEFLEKSGLNKVKEYLKGEFTKFKGKFKNKDIKQEDIDDYNNLVNAYFAMKKEIMIGAETIQSIKDTDPNRRMRGLKIGAAILEDLFNQTKKGIEEFSKGKIVSGALYEMFPILAAGGILKAVGKKGTMVNDLGNLLLKFNPISVGKGLGYQLPGNMLRRTSHIANMPECMLLHGRYNIENGDKLLLQDILEGRISGFKAESIVKKGKKKRSNGNDYESLEDFIRKMTGQEGTSELTHEIISDLFKTEVHIGGEDVEISFMKNKTLRERLLGKPKSTSGRMTQPINGYYLREYNYTGISDKAKEIGLSDLFGWDGKGAAKIHKLDINQKKFLKTMIEEFEFTDVDKQLKAIINNIEKLDFESFTEANLVELVEHLRTHPEDLLDQAKITSKIDEIKGIANPERLNEAIFGDIDNYKKSLETQLKRFNEGTPGYNSVDIQIKNVDELKKELSGLPDAEFNNMNKLINTIIEDGSPRDFTKVVNTITEIKEIEELGDIFGKKSLYKIMDNFDELPSILRKAKRTNPKNATKLENLAKTFERINDAKIAKRLGKVGDITNGIKRLVKILAKTT